MSLIRALIYGVVGMVLLGCGGGRADVAVDVVDFVSEITEAMTGARLVVEVRETEIDLTGVVLVRVVMEWGDGVGVELIEPDWEGAGWSRVTVHGGEIFFDGSVYTRVVEFELEPFLGGEYVVPSVGIRVDSEETGRRIARLQPVEIVVASVLKESDGEELDAAIGLAEMVAVEDGLGLGWGIWGGLGVAVVAGAAVLWLRRRDDGGIETVDPEAVLVVAAASMELSEEDLGALHRALVALSDEYGALGLISEEIERERFSGGAVDHRRVQSAARRALEVCGVTA